MRALDMFIDWLAEQKESEQIYIAKEILKELEGFELRDFMFEQVESLDPFSLEELYGHIEHLLLD